MSEELPPPDGTTTAPAPIDQQAAYSTLGPDLFQLILTPANKSLIFSDALSHLSSAHHESSLLLQNLQTWNPAAASLFTSRSPSTVVSTPFRLIFPNSALPSFEETGLFVRQYIAVSYCWRSEDFLPEGYERHGEWPVSKPFVDAILSDKDHPREGIWMDQLCIDQSSSVDKQQSVAAMDIIYRSCIRLLILLEDVFLDEREAALHEKYDPTKMKFERAWQPEDEEERSAFASFYSKVNSARWWERAWCFHEFNVNDPWSDKRQCNIIHNATFVLNGPRGTTVKIKWANLQLIMGSALYVLPVRVDDGAASILSEFKGQGIFTGIASRDNLPMGKRSSLMARHNGVGQKGCTHLADRVSIMINMSGLGLAYTGPPVQTTEEVLYLSAILALAAGEAYPLTMTDGKLLKLYNAPTWLSRTFAATDTSIPPFKPGSITHIHSITPSSITLDLLLFTTPWQTISTPQNLTQTYSIFPSTIPTLHPSQHLTNDYTKNLTSTTHPPTTLDPLRRSFLAACIQQTAADPTLPSRLWSQIKTDIIHANYNTGLFKDLSPHPDLRVAARELVREIFPVSTLLNIPPPSSSSSSSFTLEDAHLFLTWLADPRSMYYIGVETLRIPCTRDGKVAFLTSLTVNEGFGDGPVGELRVAVPVDLVEGSCIPARVWVLRPKKKGEEEEEEEEGGGEWRIVGKGLLLGEPDLLGEVGGCEGRGGEGGEDVVVLRERAVVGG